MGLDLKAKHGRSSFRSGAKSLPLLRKVMENYGNDKSEMSFDIVTKSGGTVELDGNYIDHIELALERYIAAVILGKGDPLTKNMTAYGKALELQSFIVQSEGQFKANI